MLDNVNMTSTRKKLLRCAIYTRKRAWFNPG